MRHRNRFAQGPENQKSLFRVRPRKFVFFDKQTGTERFDVPATPAGNLPMDQAASLIAIHCLVRSGTPKDFGVMIAPEEDLVNPLLPMATRLVQACSASRSPVHLSHRQSQVLRGLVQNFSNKELAEQLHLSVRTVKFHVSALLEKFNVHSRVCLMREAADLFAPEGLPKPELFPRRGPSFLRANGEPARRGEPASAAVRPPELPMRMVAGQRVSR